MYLSVFLTTNAIITICALVRFALSEMFLLCLTHILLLFDNFQDPGAYHEHDHYKTQFISLDGHIRS